MIVFSPLFFQSIPVTAYPLLFQQSLETNTFEDFLNIFHEDFVKYVCIFALSPTVQYKKVEENMNDDSTLYMTRPVCIHPISL